MRVLVVRLIILLTFSIVTISKAVALVCTPACAPAPENGFVAQWAGATAVPVGPRVFLSANHVGGSVGSPVQLHGTLYTAVAIQRDPALDLQIITVDQDVPAWHKIAPSTEVNVDRPVMLGGYGQGGEGELPVEWIGGTNSERWGTNTVAGFSSDSLWIEMSREGTPHESAFIAFDSGGGLFVQGADGEHYLAGIAVRVLRFTPDFTGYRDISTCVNITTTDFADLTYATVEEFNEPPQQPQTGCVVADTYPDNVINGLDFNQLLTYFGQRVPPGTNGDTDGNGAVNGLDFLPILNNFGQPCP